MKVFCTLLLLLLVFLQVKVCSAAPEFLSPKELNWLAEHRVITVGPDPDFSPFDFLDSQGLYKGMSADYLAWIGEALGISFEVIQAQNWAEMIVMAQQKKVDMIPAIAHSAQRQEYLTFTVPWITVPGVVISAKQCFSVEELIGRRVAVVDGSIWDEYLSTLSEDVSLIRVEDVRTALELTALSGVYAMVTNLASATEMIHQLGISNLRVVLRLDKKTEISFGVRKDWPELVSILNKTMAIMDPVVKEEIRHRWLNLGEIPWWRWQNSFVQRLGLTLLAGFMAIIVFFIAWNRILQQQVTKRSLALEKAQRGLIRAAKMESVGQLAAGVAHEVKNPLAIISMGLEFLSGNSGRDATEQEILVDMDDAVQRADKVIRSLLDYSRYSKLERCSCDINKVIGQSLQLVEHELNKHRIEVHTDLAPMKAAYFDFNRIQQVFINLFMNSIQAMDNDGVLEIVSRMHRLSTAEADLSQHYKPGMEIIKVMVRDTGTGIGKDDSEKIFDPFYTTKDIGQGTGLGLSESRNIMELHNGTLHLKNCKNTGACAEIILPCQKGEGNEKEDSVR